MKTSVMYLMLFMLAGAVNARPSSFVDTSIPQDGTTTLASVIPSRSSDGEGASGEEGADAVGDAFHQVALKLLQEAARRAEEAIQKVEERLNELEKQMTPSKREDADAGWKVSIENRMQKLEAYERALEQVLPGVTTRITPPESHSHPEETSAISLTSIAPSTSLALPTSISASSTATSSTISPSATTSTSPHPSSVTASGGTTMAGAEADATEMGDAAEEQRAMEEVELRIEEVKAKMSRARSAPSSLGEELWKAASRGSYRDVRRLLDSGADVNYTSTLGLDPLKYAIQRLEPNAGIVQLLVERGADVNAIDERGMSPLHMAARYDLSGRMVDLLIGAGADVDARDEDGATPLHLAAVRNNEAGVRALLAAGARKSVKGWDGYWTNKTPFRVTKSDAIRDLLRP